MGRYQKAPDVAAQPAVKSIQSGTFGWNSGSGVTINISAVDPAKCMVILNGTSSPTSGGQGAYFQSTSVQTRIVNHSLSSPTQLYISGGAFGTGNWQIVEYV